jgi:hypothetical protein
LKTETKKQRIEQNRAGQGRAGGEGQAGKGTDGGLVIGSDGRRQEDYRGGLRSIEEY